MEGGARSLAAQSLGAPLEAWFRGGGRTLVALSGGVDSAVVAAAAHAALPGEARAATLVGPSVSANEVDRARAVAEQIGIRHELVAVDPLASEAYRANPSNRCYFCRSVESRALLEHGRGWGAIRFVDGVHRDDLGDDRPGLRAMAEAGFRHPLLEAGWGKDRVRATARALGLPNWDEPSDSCLASRVPHGTPIDAELLGRIADAESVVRLRGYRRVRVRVEGAGARVELDPSELPRALAASEASAIGAEIQRLGFSPVRIDPRGYANRANG